MKNVPQIHEKKNKKSNPLQTLGFRVQSYAEDLWPLPLKHTTINISIRDVLVTLLLYLCFTILGKYAIPLFIVSLIKEPALLCFPYNVIHSLFYFTPRFWDFNALEPKLNLLLQNFVVLQKEALDASLFSVPFSSHPHQRRIAEGQPWTVFSLFSYGTVHYENCSKCPVLSSLLLQIPSIKLAMLSCMDGPTHIRTHCGYFKNIIRVHLTLHLEHPETNEHTRFIRVGDEDYHWKEGEIVAFDDTYPHEVISTVPGKRIVLFLDVERPYANYAMKKISSLFLHILQSSPNIKAAAQFQEKNALNS